MTNASVPSPGLVNSPKSEREVDAWLETVVLENYRSLYTYAMSLTLNAADAADLTQQTTVIFATRWQSILDHGKIKPWLYTTLYREFLRMKKRSLRTVSLDDENSFVDPGTPSTQAQDYDGRTALDAIHSLPEPHRSMLSLFYLEDLSYREIAELLNLPTGTVMSRLSRAKDAIRRILNPAP